MTVSVRRALARARSAEPPGPDFPAGHQVTPWPGTPVPVPHALDPLLTGALAGSRLRPSPSAGALHPVNAHLLLGPGGTLPPGRYAYDPVRHRLVPRGPACPGAPGGAIAVLTVTARRTVSHYGHRAWPLLLLDTGHAAAALALAGAPAWCPDADGALLAAAAGLRPDGHRAERTRPRRGPADPRPGRRAGALGPPTPRPRPRPPRHPVPAVLAETWRVLTALTATGRPTWRPTRAPAVPRAVLLSRRSAEPPLPGVPDGAVLARVASAARTARPPSWSVVTGRPATGPGSSPLAALAARAARQEWLTGVGALLLAHGCPDDAPPARIRRDHLLAGYGAGLAQAVAAARGLASRPVGSWQHGSGPGDGPADIVHALALGAGPDPRTGRNDGS
ncbi:hypothetical protein [Streptomyces pactum]|uniref:hypothetical protein n=1 Tax=Streptomyces pactum TaxID=68249 RepID=UPI0018D62CFE|nr:hypothetical protein [Streptomyces pactum]